MKQKSGNIKTLKALFITAGIVILALIAVFAIILTSGVIKSAQWENYAVSDADKARIAECDMLMPEIADYIESCSYCGFQDRSDAFETVWFDSAEQLFDTLPFDSGDDRQEALGYFAKLTPEDGRYRSFDKLTGRSVSAYAISEEFLPLTGDDVRGENWSYKYMYSYYIVTDGQHRTKLICVRDGF